MYSWQGRSAATLPRPVLAGRQGRGARQMPAALQVRGQQYQQLVEALADAFPDNGKLSQLLEFRLSKSLNLIVSTAADLQQVVFDLIREANAQGWTAQLIAAARESRPGNPKLLKLTQDLGLTASTADLERKVRDDLSYLNIAQWRQRLGQIETQVCRIETANAFGTGFLV